MRIGTQTIKSMELEVWRYAVMQIFSNRNQCRFFGTEEFSSEFKNGTSVCGRETVEKTPHQGVPCEMCPTCLFLYNRSCILYVELFCEKSKMRSVLFSKKK